LTAQQKKPTRNMKFAVKLISSVIMAAVSVLYKEKPGKHPVPDGIVAAF
jgi:hypothetical protein